MDEKICDIKHETIDNKLGHHERWLAEHEEKIDTLTKSDAVNSTEIKNLCSQIAGQTKAIWGLVSIVATALVGLVVYAIEKGLFH